MPQASPYPPGMVPYAAFNRPVANIYGDPSMTPQAPPGIMLTQGYAQGMAAPAPYDAQASADPAAMQQSGDCPDGCNGDEPWDVCLLRKLCGPINTDLWCDVHAHHRFYGSIDALTWWTRGNPVPALVTTSPVGTAQTAAGVLGQPGTSTLFGDQRIDTFMRGGARINFGYNLVDGEFWAVEGHYLALGQGGTSYSQSSNFTTGVGDTILARPFYNTQTGAQDSALVAFPNYNLNGTLVNLNGGVDIRSTANLQSAGALLKHLLWIDFTSEWRLDLVGGYRFFRADDSVSINDNFTTQGGLLAPTTFTSQDVFGARNVFNGGEFGFLLQKKLAGRLSMSSLWKVAFGNVNERVTINGSNTITTLGTSVTTPGGFLTQPSNIGTYTRNQFGVLPEVQLNLRYDLTQNWRFVTGYTFIWLNQAQRSGAAIDTTVNPTQLNGGTLVGPARPAFAFSDTSYWAQGLNFGLEYRW